MTRLFFARESSLGDRKIPTALDVILEGGEVPPFEFKSVRVKPFQYPFTLPSADYFRVVDSYLFSFDNFHPLHRVQRRQQHAGENKQEKSYQQRFVKGFPSSLVSSGGAIDPRDEHSKHYCGYAPWESVDCDRGGRTVQVME